MHVLTLARQIVTENVNRAVQRVTRPPAQYFYL